MTEKQLPVSVRASLTATVLMLILMMFIQSASALSNSGGSWPYSREISISNPGAALSDYHVLVSSDIGIGIYNPSSSQSYDLTVNLTDVAPWNSASVSENTISLGAGETKQIEVWINSAALEKYVIYDALFLIQNDTEDFATVPIRLNVAGQLTVVNATLTISSYYPPTPENDTAPVTRTFNITVNQMVNVDWYFNGILEQTNLNITSASYTKTTNLAGVHNVTAFVQNTNGSGMQTWIWNVRVPLTLIPAGYYGSVTVNGQPANPNTKIIAKIAGEERGSIITTASGSYGGAGGPDPKLWVMGFQGESGSPVTFCVAVGVDCVAAQQTTAWISGDIKQVDLTFVNVPTTPVLTTILVSPKEATVVAGSTRTFTASPRDQFGNPISAAISWSSSNTAIGTVNPATGLSTVFTALSQGTSTITASSATVSGTATATVSAAPPPGTPAIVSFTPATPVNDHVGASRTFDIALNQTVNVTWYINGTEVQTNLAVTTASYTNTSAAVGTWNVTAIARNANGEASQRWIWNVTTSDGFVIPFPTMTAPPTDPDLDGIFEDINGNGRKDFNDVVLFFNNLEWVTGNEPLNAFDSNQNGRIDFADIVRLFEEI